MNIDQTVAELLRMVTRGEDEARPHSSRIADAGLPWDYNPVLYVRQGGEERFIRKEKPVVYLAAPNGDIEIGEA